jgi:histidinol-phosphate phosphatase family protein
MPDFLTEIDQSWTLFLDRDGVINKRPPNDYVKSWAEFEFLPGVLEALQIFTKKFRRIIIVTNQQGIGKNIMTPEDLQCIHDQLILEVEKSGGRIDAIYFCPDLATRPNSCRKPSVKMAMQAKIDLPEIDLAKSIMTGDTLSDLQFGRNAGMKTVFINTNDSSMPATEYDLNYHSLHAFARAINAND